MEKMMSMKFWIDRFQRLGSFSRRSKEQLRTTFYIWINMNLKTQRLRNVCREIISSMPCSRIYHRCFFSSGSCLHLATHSEALRHSQFASVLSCFRRVRLSNSPPSSKHYPNQSKLTKPNTSLHHM